MILLVAALTDAYFALPFAGELSEVSEDNIIDGERSAKPTSFKGDDELDAKVDEVAQNDGEFKNGSLARRRALANN